MVQKPTKAADREDDTRDGSSRFDQHRRKGIGQAQGSQRVELRQYLRIVRKWLWLIVLGTLLAGAIAYGVSAQLPPVYSASTSLLIRTSSAKGEDYASTLLNQYLAATYRELLTKRPIIESAGRNLDLAPSAISGLSSQVTVWVVPDTSLIRLAVEDHDPRLARDLANEIISVFVQAQRESDPGYGEGIFVVEPATQPVEPVAPRILFNTLVAAIGGCALATGVAFLAEYLDDTLGTAEDIHHSLSLPTLAAIPRPIRLQKRDKTPITLADPTSSLAEAYRTLHARLQFSNAIHPSSGNGMLEIMLVTSPQSRREKANIAVNLGAVMAQAGLRVLLVDADLRQPGLHQIFGLNNETGLTTLLAGDGSCEECISETGIPNLRVLASGSVPEALVLSWQQVPQLLEELRTRSDVVLFDAPPVLAAADAMVLASQVDGTILAVRSGSTRREVAMQAIQRLRDVQAKMTGVVLTRV